MSYLPGTHILGTIHTRQFFLLEQALPFQTMIGELIERLALHQVGEVIHSFENAGFTAVICLTESHISIHTWPEFGLLNYDVYLSNLSGDNRPKAQAIARELEQFFMGETQNYQEIRR
ncbi:adenosylmethionine decarboxylase [Bacteroidota bacterium]